MLNDNTFFKPTALYKEYMILDMLEKNANITQREMSKTINISVSMVNYYLDQFEKNQYIIREKFSSKIVRYIITKQGIERRQLLNINYLHNSQIIYNAAKSNIIKFLEGLISKKTKNLVIYGAGEVATIILTVLLNEKRYHYFNLIIVDDDPNKIGRSFLGFMINSPDIMRNVEYDSVFLGSYTFSDLMFEQTLSMGIPPNKIIKYF